VLVTAHNRAAVYGRKFVLSSPTPQFLRLIQIFALIDFFDFES
jgi:hypothetical protein